MNWHQKMADRKDSLLEDLAGLLRIESVYDPGSSAAGQPMGQGIAQALNYMLDLSAANGFRVRNHEGYVGYAEFGPESAEHYVAVLSHLDVVPVSGQWTTPPFEPSIRDGKVFARGAIDDKGPAMAAFYGLKLVKELGLPLKHRVRLIFGTDEELTSRCMDKYRELEPAPLCGFTPDADFPIVRAEKGQINTRILLRSMPEDSEASAAGEFKLLAFHGGGVANMVPEAAEAEVSAVAGDLDLLIKAYKDYCESHNLTGSVERKGGTAVFQMKGKAAHGMEPHLGRNAGLELIHFLNGQSFQSEASRFLGSLDALLYDDLYGHGFGIAMEDEISGPLTVNCGIQQFQPDGESFFHINLRFPSCGTCEGILRQIGEKTKDDWEIETPNLKNPHFVSDDHPMIIALQRIYEEETGDKAELLSTGGGTYGAHIPNGVAFGPVFPGMTCTAHQRDEYIEIENLLRAAAIYARAIYELGNLDI